MSPRGRLYGKNRILGRCIIDENGCWVWQSHLDRDGYGRVGGPAAHRVSYEMFVGEIPPGLTIDHLCRNRACVNPAHLEPVTMRENTRRGSRANKTHCKYGHEYTPENTHRNSEGSRVCRACGREASRRRRRGLRATPVLASAGKEASDVG